MKRVMKVRSRRPDFLLKSASFSRPLALLHGGLGDGLKDRSKFLKSLSRISKLVRSLLNRPALDISIAAVGELEKDPLFNAGFGAKLQRDGVARLSGALMDGARQRMAGVSNLEGYSQTSLLARKLIEEDSRILAGLEASRFALAKGFSPQSAITESRLLEWKSQKESFSGTVGCVALDSEGRTAACTSTGGRGFETPGRVSDSSSPAGNFATPYGAVSCTGTGEDILEAAVASSILTRLEDGLSLTEAVQRTLRPHQKRNFGLIALTEEGEALVGSTRGEVSFALVSSEEIWFGFAPQDWISYGSAKSSTE